MFTCEEISFLEKHDIFQEDVMDVQGMRVNEWKAAAKDAGFRLVLCSPGMNCNHRIKARSGNCCQCNTSAIKFSGYFNGAGTVYIAYSPSEQLVKIGHTRNLDSRLQNLISQGYGECIDWTIIAYSESEECQKSEINIRKAIGARAVVRGYLYRNSGETTREIMECDPRLALLCFQEELISFDNRDHYIDLSFVDTIYHQLVIDRQAAR